MENKDKIIGGRHAETLKKERKVLHLRMVHAKGKKKPDPKVNRRAGSRETESRARHRDTDERKRCKAESAFL